MKIIGIDPGTIRTGYGIIDYQLNKLNLICSGTIETAKEKELAARLEIIYKEINELIRNFAPEEFAIETAFFGKNIQSAIKLGHARGVAFLAASQNNLKVNEYSPREVKRAVVGNGAATKEQVKYMVQNIFKIKKAKLKLDETDAIAIAACHAFRLKNFSTKKNSWKDFIKLHPEKIIG